MNFNDVEPGVNINFYEDYINSILPKGWFKYKQYIVEFILNDLDIDLEADTQTVIQDIKEALSCIESYDYEALDEWGLAPLNFYSLEEITDTLINDSSDFIIICTDDKYDVLIAYRVD